ncbi:MAG: hypothetical protein IKF52_00515 [Clostridia bacterium]|nr:hypothetical protein [Clostridia bacterium]
MQEQLMKWRDNKTHINIRTTKKSYFSTDALILSWDEIGIVIINGPYDHSSMKSGKQVIPWNNIISIYESHNHDTYDDCSLNNATEETSDDDYNSEFDIRNIDGNADFFMSCD